MDTTQFAIWLRDAIQANDFAGTIESVPTPAGITFTVTTRHGDAFDVTVTAARTAHGIEVDGGAGRWCENCLANGPHPFDAASGRYLCADCEPNPLITCVNCDEQIELTGPAGRWAGRPRLDSSLGLTCPVTHDVHVPAR